MFPPPSPFKLTPPSPYLYAPRLTHVFPTPQHPPHPHRALQHPTITFPNQPATSLLLSLSLTNRPSVSLLKRLTLRLAASRPVVPTLLRFGKHLLTSILRLPHCKQNSSSNSSRNRLALKHLSVSFLQRSVIAPLGSSCASRRVIGTKLHS